MRSLLEKSIVHLLNGDHEKAEALFHKFMVERARKVHESLRQDEDVDLSHEWDSEITEEEYFDPEDMEPNDDETPNMADPGAEADAETDVEGGDDDVGLNDVGDAGDEADLGDEEDLSLGEPEEGQGDLGQKIDSLEDKVDELTQEFERLMAEFSDEGSELGDLDDEEGDLAGEEGDLADDVADEVGDDEGEEPVAPEDGGALADRMETDLSDKEGDEPEEEAMELADTGFDDDEESALEEDLADITEAVMWELEKISAPSNTDGKEIGTGGQITGNRDKGMLPKHPADDRVNQAKPYMVKGGNYDKFPPEWKGEGSDAPVKGVDAMVKGARNSRKNFKDGMEQKSKEGDAGAALNRDYASRPSTQSTLDGKKSK